MLNNYKKDEYGVIHQIEYKKYPYSIDYNKNYDKLGEISNRMSYLRLGYMIGSIGCIPDSILDIGVGNGSFISLASKIIKNCYINDITKIEIKDTKWTDDLNIPVHTITMFDVLEHLEDITIIKEFNCKYLVLSVPNCLYGDDDIWFSHWKHLKPNEHLHHFNEISLARFVESMGYKHINSTGLEDIIRENDCFPNIITETFFKI